MEANQTTQTTTQKFATDDASSPHKHTSVAVTSIAGCALCSFAIGAVLGAAWPGAIVACALSLMGVLVAFIMLRRA
jgi:hypothetical protein